MNKTEKEGVLTKLYFVQVKQTSTLKLKVIIQLSSKINYPSSSKRHEMNYLIDRTRACKSTKYKSTSTHFDNRSVTKHMQKYHSHESAHTTIETNNHLVCVLSRISRLVLANSQLEVLAKDLIIISYTQWKGRHIQCESDDSLYVVRVHSDIHRTATVESGIFAGATKSGLVRRIMLLIALSRCTCSARQDLNKNILSMYRDLEPAQVTRHGGFNTFRPFSLLSLIKYKRRTVGEKKNQGRERGLPFPRCDRVHLYPNTSGGAGTPVDSVCHSLGHMLILKYERTAE